VLHGTEIQKEFTDNFPDFSNKIVIQMHGIYYNQSTDYLIRNIDDNIVEKVNNFQRIYLFSGLIFYNKGVDRLMRIWREKFHDSSTLLIVSGEVKETYDELENEINMISRGNTVFLPGYSSNDLFNYLMNVCDLLILPYRHASVSGLIFTASNFKKPVLATRTGSISEYIKHNDSGFIVENTDEDIFNMLKEIESNYTKESLAVIGQSLARSINEAYNWDNIATKLVNQAYNNEE
jgi:glycosyltransferase involved in cell wall biosynthesis